MKECVQPGVTTGELDALAHEVMQREHSVDEFELKLDEEIVSVIARRGPMARDLRILMSFSKSVADMRELEMRQRSHRLYP